MFLRNDDLEEEIDFLNRRETRQVELVSRFPCIHNAYFDCQGCGECMQDGDE